MFLEELAAHQLAVKYCPPVYFNWHMDKSVWKKRLSEIVFSRPRSFSVRFIFKPQSFQNGWILATY